MCVIWGLRKTQNKNIVTAIQSPPPSFLTPPLPPTHTHSPSLHHLLSLNQQALGAGLKKRERANESVSNYLEEYVNGCRDSGEDYMKVAVAHDTRWTKGSVENRIILIHRPSWNITHSLQNLIIRLGLRAVLTGSEYLSIQVWDTDTGSGCESYGIYFSYRPEPEPELGEEFGIKI